MKIPISFYDHKICPHCASQSVKPIDKYGRSMDIAIYPLSKLHCEKCGSDFVPVWIPKEDGSEMQLLAGDNELVSELEQLINEYAESKRRNIYDPKITN